MKRPLLNLHQRQSIYLKTTIGACLEFGLSIKHLLREIKREFKKLLRWN